VSQDQFLQAGQQFVFLDPETRERRKFTIVSPLGRGAFAQSFLASGEEGYAVLKSSVNAEGENIDLGAEAQVLCDLNHPNVVRYFGTAFDHQWRIVLAFERLFDNPLLLYNHVVDVKSLETHPGGRYHPLPVATSLNLLMDLLCGLESMHEAGYVHADVKPANFMVQLGHEAEQVVPERLQLKDIGEGRGRGVLIDVGGCWSFEALEEHNAGQAEQGPQLTPLYAPPEAVLDDNRTPGGRGRLLHPSMDTYSAALVFYVTLTGRAPYAHLGAKAKPLVEAKRHERRGSLSPIDPGAIQALSDFTVRGMRERELTSRLIELLQDWLAPDPQRRTVVAKARRQLEEAFDFLPNEAGLLRQSVVAGHLSLPPEPRQPGTNPRPRPRPVLSKRPLDESRATKRVRPLSARPTAPRQGPLAEAAPERRPAPSRRPPGTSPPDPRGPRAPKRPHQKSPPLDSTPRPAAYRSPRPEPGRRQPGRPPGPRPKPGPNKGPSLATPKRTPSPPGSKSAGRPAAPRRPSRGKPKPSKVYWLLSPVFPRPLSLQGDRSYILGRAGKADLPIPSDLISRCHASLSWEGDLLLLRDLGSTNGTTINGRPLPKGDLAPLRNGSRFSLGGFEIQVHELPRGKVPGRLVEDPEGATRILKLSDRPQPEA